MKHKTKILASLAILAVSSAYADHYVTDNLELRGFVDSSYRSIDDNGKSETLGVDNLDVDFLFGFDKVSSEVHLAESGGDITLEQAFVSYDLSDQVTVTAGKYLSLLGYEGDEPTKLYQDTMAYYWHRSGADTNKIPFAAYHQGVKIGYASGNVTATLSFVDNVYNSDGDAEDVGYEAQIKYSGIENLLIAVGTAREGDAIGATNIDNYVNVWAEYRGVDKTIIGAEYNEYDIGSSAEGDSYMIMVNYEVSDAVSLTVRYSEVDEDTAAAYESDKFTVSPSYTITENLLGRVEYSSGEDNGQDVDFFSLGAIFTF